MPASKGIKSIRTGLAITDTSLVTVMYTATSVEYISKSAFQIRVCRTGLITHRVQFRTNKPKMCESDQCDVNINIAVGWHKKYANIDRVRKLNVEISRQYPVSC